MKYDQTLYSFWYTVSVNGPLTKDVSYSRQFSNSTMRVAQTCQPQSHVNSWCSHTCSQIMRSNKLHCKLTQATERLLDQQTTIPDVLAKGHTRCFSKGSYQMFQQKIIPEVLAKDHTRCFSKGSYQMFWQRIIQLTRIISENSASSMFSSSMSVFSEIVNSNAALFLYKYSVMCMMSLQSNCKGYLQ